MIKQMGMLIHDSAQPRFQTPHCAELCCALLASACGYQKKEIVSSLAHNFVDIS